MKKKERNVEISNNHKNNSTKSKYWTSKFVKAQMYLNVRRHFCCSAGKRWETGHMDVISAVGFWG